MADINEIGRKPERFKEHEATKKGIDLFFRQEEMDFMLSVGRELSENILKESFLLYRIDKLKTRGHKLYGESKSKVYLPEVQIFGRINVESNAPSFQVSGGVIKQGLGKFTGEVYIDHLKELELVDFEEGNELVLNFSLGDYIGFKGQFYRIVDDGYSNTTNEHSFGGDRRFYITMTAIEVDKDEFDGR